VPYYPFQPSEVPGTLGAWLISRNLAIANVRIGLSYSCDDQEGCASLAWRDKVCFVIEGSIFNQTPSQGALNPSITMEQANSHELNSRLRDSTQDDLQPLIIKRVLIKYLLIYRILLRRVQPQLHRHVIDLRSPRLPQGSTCSKTSLVRLDFPNNSCAMLRIA
jgi:hypothetical protein